MSVVVPAYNHARFLPETLDSILAQEGVSLEVLVVDDGSTDDTQAVLARYAGRVRSIRLERNSGGPSIPRNVGIRAVSGPLLSVVDADDILSPGKLGRAAALLEAHPDIPFVFNDFVNFDGSGEKARFLSDHKVFRRTPMTELEPGSFRIKASDAFRTLMEDNFVGMTGAVFRKSLWEELGGFKEDLKNSDDFYFFIQTARKYDMGFIDGVLHKRRVHPANISSRSEAALRRLRLRLEIRAEVPMEPEMTGALDRTIADFLISIGWRERMNGRRWPAFKAYFKAWTYRKSNLRPWLSIVRLLFPL